ncbi:MAG: M48 family metallopeptidase [Moraxellaceae bacterium]|jgi:heat shock protein HtpX
MAEFIGLHQQIKRNNTRSIIILLCFPLLILVADYAFLFFSFNGKEHQNEVNQLFLQSIPFVILGVGVWFAIAYFANATMIRLATNAETLERQDNMRVYNLTENLCMSVGMKMPKLYVIQSPALNAFASGIDEKSYAVTLTTGIINHLSDEELEGVIAHELTHIRNKDVRLLIVTIIFVGIFSFLVQVLFRSLLFGGNRRRDKDSGGGQLVIIALVISVVAYLLTILFKFALSRKREYLADAGAVEMTRNSMAMASALRKISGNSEVDSVKSDDVKELFIEYKSVSGLFSTHPPIEKRIAVLEQM